MILSFTAGPRIPPC